jgi:anaerobic selenocysteine-containing dehydrogenase
MSQHFRTCHLCEAMCGIEIEHEGGKILSIRGDHEDPFSQGHVCPKALAIKDVDEDPDRLTRPLRRTKDGFEPVSWEDAFELAASRLAAIRREHGKDSVAVYIGNPTVHNYGTLLYALELVGALRTKNRYSATSVDHLPRIVSSYHVFGHQLLMPVPDLDRTDFLLVIGANPLVSNGSLMTAPGVGKRLAAIKARGGEVVVLDPRRTETAEIATSHHFIRPGTDAFFLLGMLHAVLEKGANLGRLAAFTDGLPAVLALVRRFPPERVAQATGVPADVIRAIALRFAASQRAVCYGRVGTCMQEFGGLSSWLVDVLNVVTGNLDRPGGALFTRPAADLLPLASLLRQRGSFGTFKTRVRGLPEFAGELPVAALAEEIETEGKGKIRALVTLCGNPVLSTPNGRRLERALGKLDFMVSLDIYRNETTNQAHLILPPSSPLEQDQYDLALHLLAVRDTAKFSPALRAPAPDARADWQILHELARRLLAKGNLLERAAAPLVHFLYGRHGPRALLDKLLRRGSYGLSVAKLEESPHGVDLGPLKPCLPERLEGRRIQLAPEAFLADVPRLEAALAQPTPELALISRRQLRSNNSWMHNAPRLMRGKPRCSLLVHPDDARARKLESGQTARVTSRVGSVDVPVEVSDEVMPGVVCLPHGWGHARPGVALRVAGAQPGSSVNDLTDEARIDGLVGVAALSGVPVKLEGLV